MQFKRGTAARWATVNPVLASGEPGFETDTGKQKIGDGTTVWTALPYQGGGGLTVLSPSGDTSGNTDTATLNTACNVAGHVLLAKGNWYVKSVGLTTNDVWVQGSGTGTVLNVITGFNGFTITGPGNLQISDMLLTGGNYGLVVNGAYDSDFRNLWLKAHTLGGIKINGDAATEQNYKDITMRGVGGIAFALDRTTTIYTGSIYLDRVRTVEPAAGATFGFRFNSTAGSPSLNIAFMTQCVADNYAGDAYSSVNCAQVFVAQCWFAINASSPAGSVALRVNGGFMHSYVGNYTYSGLTAAVATVKIEGSARGVDIDGGHVFDGTPTNYAINVATAAANGFTLGSYQNYCQAGLTDSPTTFMPSARALPGKTNKHGEEPLSRLFCTATPGLTSGTLVLSYFTAEKSEVISTIECMVNNGASGGTYAGMGLYTVNASGDLLLVAKGEATTLFSSAFQPVGGFNTKIGLSSVYSKVAGQQYAIGALFVGTTAPALVSAVPSSGTPGSNGGSALAATTLGQLSGQKAGQSTLGTIGTTTHTAASISGWAWMPWFVLN